MTNVLILAKHSLPEIVEGLPAHKWRLSAEGRERAERLAQRLTDFQPEVIVCSNEPKARETAEIVAKMHRLPLHVADDLHEHDRADVPFMAPDDFRMAMVEFFRKPGMLVFGNETADQAQGRFERALSAVLGSHANRRIAIVAHGTVISLFVARRIGIPPLSLWNELGLPSFVVMDIEANTLVAREYKI